MMYCLLGLVLCVSPLLVNYLFDNMPTTAVVSSSLAENDFDGTESVVFHGVGPFRPSKCFRMSGALYWVWAMSMMSCVLASVATVLRAGMSFLKDRYAKPSWHWLLPFSSLTCVVLGNALGCDMAYHVMFGFPRTVLVSDVWMQGLNFTTYCIVRSSFFVFCSGMACFVVSNMILTCAQSSQKRANQAVERA